MVNQLILNNKNLNLLSLEKRILDQGFSFKDIQMSRVINGKVSYRVTIWHSVPGRPFFSSGDLTILDNLVTQYCGQIREKGYRLRTVYINSKNPRNSSMANLLVLLISKQY